jgi:hypothetical protein
VQQFEQLWADDYLGKGVRELRRLLKEGINQVAEVKRRLYEMGITGLRLARVKEKASVYPRRSDEARQRGPQFYEVVAGGPQKQSLKREANAVAALKKILANGPVPAKRGWELAKQHGLWLFEIEKAVRTLEIKSRRMKCWQGPFYWCLPGQEPPRNQEDGTARSQPSASAQGRGSARVRCDPGPDKPQRTGRPPSLETLARYKVCYELYTGPKKLAAALVDAHRLLGSKAPRSQSHLRLFADRYAAAMGWPKPPRR